MKTTPKTINQDSPASDYVELILPIRFHPCLDECFEDWAQECRRKPDRLRKAIIQAIRTRHHEAEIDHPCQRAHDGCPDIYALALGSITIHFSIVLTEVTVRGFGWPIKGEPRGDFDGGAIFTN